MCVYSPQVLSCTHACKYLSSDPGQKCLASAHNLASQSGRGGGGGHTYTSNTLHRKSALCSFMLIHVYCIKHLAMLQLALVVILPFLLFPFALPSCYNDGNVCMFSQDDAAQPNVLHHGQTHRGMTEPGFLSYPLLSLSRLCEMNCEDSRCRGVSQCELLLHLITARNGTAEPSFFFTFRLAS